MTSEKLKVATISVLSNLVLTIGKLVAGLLMGSVSVISEAIHSGLDLVASLVAYFSLRQSGKPADEDHRYGHGKFENVAAIVEALLILAAAAAIIGQAVLKLYRGGHVESLNLGIVVMGMSSVVNFLVSGMLMRTAKRTDSPALEADAWHLRTDVYTSFSVFVGIILIKITGINQLDPIIALGVSALIIKAAFDLLIKSASSIVDARLSDEEEKIIMDVLNRHSGEYVHFHKLRTRRAGPERHVDLHLVVPRMQRIYLAHELCDRIEQDVRQSMRGVNVLIHAEPCKPCPDYCLNCTLLPAAGRQQENKNSGDSKGCQDCDGCN
ncbi:cobalt-zinc-cadmium resistance protein [Desulfocucumis palustris]|uniref:Cobalt-zinc-cadmium resistance protein n=1 Tax=Desulfocucumis palustris TaxID=1898651 RepID=A0A2L2XBV6_9FIRM|nr:cation diffusion facilitator family transporter [Desulfocucumis palustris]GBF33610.1 cobalt-zinc-cadmium resistance protein [Desulfocucumis palustris]